jgi:hypothetical protein
VDRLLLIVLVFGLLLVMASGIGLGIGPRGQSRAFQYLARAVGGRFQRGGLWRGPNVRFRYGSTWVLVTQTASAGRPGRTQAILSWPDAKCQFQLETPPRSSGGAALSVSGSEQAEVDKLLSDGVRWQIARLQQCRAQYGLRLSIARGRFVVETPALIRRGADLEEFTRLALELFDQALLTCGEGIEFVEHDQAQPVGEPVCPVCCGPIRSELVFCRRCRTPHHLECWRYNGGCSTYACRETRYAIPRVARPITHPSR